jgi:hypothetical protein
MRAEPRREEESAHQARPATMRAEPRREEESAHRAPLTPYASRPHCP